MSESTNVTTEPTPRVGSRVILMVVVAVLLLIALGIAWRGNALKSKPKLVLITSTENPYWDRVISGAQKAASSFGAEITVVRNKGDAKQQLQSVQEAIDAGASGIAVSPIDPAVQTSALAEAAKKVPLVMMDSDCPGSNRTAFIGTDNYAAGRLCGRLVRDAVPDGGEVILCVGSINTNGRDRRRGVIDVLLDRPFDPNGGLDRLDRELKGDKYTVAATLLDGIDPARATTLAVEAIGAHPNVKCFVGLFGYSTPAVLEALKQTGKLGHVKVVGFDEAEPTLAGIESGNVAGTVLQDQYMMGFDSVLCLWRASRGTFPQAGDESKYLPCREVNDQNVMDIRYERERDAKTRAPAEASLTR